MQEISSNTFIPPHPLKTAVLFLVFNRPDTTKQVFESIRKAKPPRLYIAADGPRVNKPGELEKCEQVQQIAAQVDWVCEVKTLFRNKNLGCRVAVSSAIDWFFENEEEGIILEDDCLPDLSWFPFAEEMLDRYREDKRIMCITADHFHGDAHRPEHSYYFGIYNHCWGWASWKRAWSYYDHEMKYWPIVRDTPWLLEIGNGNRFFQDYWKRIFDMAYEGIRVDTWDYRWTFSCWLQHGLTILPAKNLVKNIGMNSEATHTTSTNKLIDNLLLEKLDFPLSHPDYMTIDLDADRWEHKYIFGITWLECLVSNFKLILKKLLFISN